MISFPVFTFLTFFLALLAIPLPTSAAPAHIPDSIPDPASLRHSVSQISAFLLAHNRVRLQHNALPLHWSVSLAEKAEQWADACNFKHTNGVLSDTPYGENIVAATGDFPIRAAVATFTQDAASYDPAHPAYNHFTQVVWESTTELGCAVSTCNNIFDSSLGPATLYVCLYNPVGNVIGEILDNVHL